MSVIDAEIIIRTEKALAEIRKIPGVTETEARKMAASLSREWKNAEKASEKHAKAAAQAWEKGLGSVKSSAEKLATQLGGPFGDMADLALDLGEKLSGTAGAIGAAGAAAGVAVASVAALAIGTKALADAAIVSRDRLIEMGLGAAIPPEASASLAHYQTASTDLRTELDLLTVSLGSGVADTLGDVSHATIGLIETFERLGGIVPSLPGPLVAIGEALSWVNPVAWELWAVNEAFDYYVGVGKETAATTRENAAAVKAATIEYAAMGPTLEDMAGGERKAAEAARARAEAQRAATAASAEAVAEGQALWATIEGETKALQDAEDAKANAAILAMRQADAQREAAAASRELAADSAALTAAADEAAAKWGSAGFAVQVYAANLDALASSPAAEAVIDGFHNVIDLQEQQHEAAVEQMQERMDRGREEIEAWSANESEKVARMLASGQIDGKQAIERRKAIQMEARARREALQDETKAERAALQRSFKAHKKMQQVAAIIDAARAAMALVPAFAFLGPGAPVAAAGVAGTALAVQLGAIGKQKAPEFPMGYAPASPDHGQSVRIQPGREAILNERGVANAGGAAAVRGLNDGSAAQGPPRVVVQLGRRVVAEVLAAAGGPSSPDPRRGKVDPWVSQG